MILAHRHEESMSLDWQGQRGVALVAALLVVLVLSTLTAAVVFISTTETWTSANYRTLLQARYAAEAGAQRAANWLAFTYTPPASYTSFVMSGSPVLYNGNPVVLSAMTGVTSNYPDAAVRTAFSGALQGVALPGLTGATYSVTATLMTMNSAVPTRPSQRWQIASTGSIAGVRPASVQVVLTIERTISVTPGFALFATSTECGALSMSGSTYTDSFDSGAGTYAATHTNSGGDVGTNGNLDMEGSSNVWGILYGPNTQSGNCPRALHDSSSGGVSGGIVQLSGQTFPTPPVPSPLPPTTNFNIPSNGYTLVPGTYGNISCSGGKTFYMTPGTYNLNSIAMSGGADLVVTVGPVIINIRGQGVSTPINFSGGTTQNDTGVASNLQFNYGGNGDVTLSSGGTAGFEIINAPNADVSVSGGGNIYGSIIGHTITMSGGADIHFDRALLGAGSGAAATFRPVAFSWSKY